MVYNIQTVSTNQIEEKIMLTVTFAGDELVLNGEQLKVGDKLPAATLVQPTLEPFSTADTSGLRVFLTVPSIDTPVCDLEIKTFNKNAGEMPEVSFFAVSADLPFAQARWFAEAGIDNIKALSDYNGAAFAKATGTFIEVLALLTRAVFIVDATDTVIYAEFVSEITNAPDYDAVISKLATLV